MSDQPGAGSLPELTPEQESEVRRLLAEARHDEPIPAEVGDRLDRVLAGLSRDQPGAPGVAPVYDLAARRRRRNAAALLAGAAAVIVAGFAVGQVIDVGDSADDAGGGSAVSGSAARDQADSQQPGDGKAGDESGNESGNDSGGANESEEPRSPAATLPAPLLLSSSNLEQDVTRQLKRSSGSTAAHDAAPEAFSAYGCPPPAAGKYGLGDLFPALYDGQPAVLALRPATGSTQRAVVLECGTADQLNSVTIPRR
jgi:hypothetical protein